MVLLIRRKPGMKSRITDEMYARIPALLEQGTTKPAIAAMFGVTLGTLAVRCSQHGISLRKAARSLGKGSIERLVSDLLEKVASDDLYMAVLDEEAIPDTRVTPAPQNDPTSPPPSEQMVEFVSPPLVSDQDSGITADATTISA